MGYREIGEMRIPRGYCGYAFLAETPNPRPGESSWIPTILPASLIVYIVAGRRG